MFVPDVFCGSILNFGDVDMKIKNALPFNILSKITLENYKVFNIDEEWLLMVLNLDPHIPVFKDEDGKYYIVVDKNDEDMIRVVEVMINGFI